MEVDTQGQGVSVEVIHRVEVLQEGVSNQEQILVLTGQSALVHDEVAFLVGRLVKILLWVDLKHVV